ncbi:MAG: nitrogenase iron-molybdenum protein subunit alpha [Oscillospiraceae bacterium]|jgi:nitrogenase molybdenum-iron protein alpha chain|nr:nitrogenase iron-molybdenum protein subunit alpha [Oscillospiraceae bacterium]
MNYFDQKIQPVRDQRLTIIDSFCGGGCDLLDCARSGCALRQNRRFWQANACQMALTIMMASTVENAQIIMHGPIGCGQQMNGLVAQGNRGRVSRGLPMIAPRPWLSTNLKESDVIGGGEQKLREAIEFADREYRPEIIFVISTCAPNIIGDDVEEVVCRAQETTAATVVGLHCPGFKSRVVASAYDAFYHGLLRHLKFEPEPYKDFLPLDENNPEYERTMHRFQFEKRRTVNIFNATSIGAQDEQELTRLLEALGLKVRIFAEYSSLDKMRMISHAALNVSMCNVHDDYMLSFLKEKYGMPYVIAGMPLGVKATREWLLAIAKHFGLEEQANRLADAEEARVNEAIEPFLPKLRGKRVLLCGGIVRVGVEAVMLSELGMDVIGARLYHYDTGADPIIEDMADNLPDMQVAVSNQIFELVNQVNTYKPDLMVSHAGTHGWLARTGVPSVQLFNAMESRFAYNGLFTIISRMALALENPSYEKRLAAHTRLPYKESWYEKNPFSYLKS